MRPTRLSFVLAGFAALGTAAFGFNGHIATEGPLTVTIAEIATVKAVDVPQPCVVTLANAGAAPLNVVLEMSGLVDECRASGDPMQRIAVPAGSKASATFHFRCGRGTHPAHYPIHIQASFEENGARRKAHAVQVFQTEFSAVSTPASQPVVRVPASGALALAPIKTQRVVWSYLGESAVPMPVGWTGSDAGSAATFSRAPMTRGGETRAALQMHPPYRPRAGTVFVEYRLKLPATTPIRVEFFNAIRDSSPREGTSDGVTFRVWAEGEKLFERHTDAKAWTRGEADLSALAGKEILLRLESHPGPKNNTVCDSSFWGDPVVFVGERPQVADVERLRAKVTALLRRGRGDPAETSRPEPGVLFYELDDHCRAVVALGPNGLADGVIGFGDATRQVVFDGLHLAVRDQTLGSWPTAVLVDGVDIARENDGRIRITHRLRLEDRIVPLVATLSRDGPALRIKVECPDAITGIGLKSADQRASRVYYGHGYCIVEPQTFRAAAGGHNLATSHVGFDFERGLSLLVASDTPPDYLHVDPERRLYQLHTHPDATLTFVPGTRGAFDCAIRYRPLYDKHAAPGVAHKAGRFVFDLWGGRYADNAAKLARCFDYGLTHSLAIIHTWQRWGYDYRLPDIFPPLPSLGTLAELQALGELCRARGALWGVHDNYIDFYPDADGFSYENITFTEDGNPRRAWLNESREAQSYQFRPDRFQPFLERNLQAIVPALRPTTSFVDVFASMPTFDFRDRQGNLHSKRETQRAWGDAFATIRNALGHAAPTVSEAGGDYLIGWLDGADAQFLQISPKPAPFHNAIVCRDWERVPWFDAVNHTRFSLHGVGYSDRYQGGRSREEHGIESDDYLSAELLTAHALMIDAAAMGRGAVRKYWLAQDFIESVARDEIRRVEFDGGDIHRVIVTWNSGARVCVNRGETDWTIGGHTLPRYGYWAQHGAIESSIERFGPAIAEQSRAPGKYYFNSRVFNPAAPLAITPTVQHVEYLGGRQFRLVVNWDAQHPAPRDCAVFYHFSRPTPGRRALTEFSGGGTPKIATSQWRSRITTGADWTISIPADMPAGDYEILVGFHDLKNRGARERLLGEEDSRRRYRVGKLTLEANQQTEITGVRLTSPAEPYAPPARWVTNVEPVDFGVAKTTGAFRCETAPDHVLLTPLPDGADFAVQLRLPSLVGRRVSVRSIEAVGAHGESVSPVSFSAPDNELNFAAAKSVTAYRINFNPAP